MTGEKVKSLIFARGYSVAQVAELIGTSQQNLAASLKHTDIRSGLIERIAEALDIKLSEFYGASFGPDPVMTPSTLESSSDFVNTTDKLLELLKVKDEQLTLAMQQTSTAQAQTDEALAQMKQLVGAVTSQPAAGALAGQAVQPVIITAPPTGKIVTTTADKLTLTKASRRAGMITGIKGKKLTVKPKIG